MNKIILSQLLLLISIACFAQKASYTFANGSINDISGNGHDAIKVGNPIAETDRFGNPECAYNFPGTANDYLNIPFQNAFNINPLNALSISLWYKGGSPDGSDFEVLFGKGSDQHSSHDYHLALYDLNKPSFGSTFSPIVMPIALAPYQGDVNGWTHLVAIYNNLRWELFVNTKLVQKSILPDTFSINMSNSDISIGKYFQGSIDDINFYNSALTLNDVISLYNDNNSCATTLMKRAVEPQISIYPNPAYDFFTVNWGFTENEQLHYLISDIKGYIIKSGSISQTMANVDIKELNAGMYFIKIEGARLNYFQKFVKL